MAFYRVQGRRALLGSVALIAATEPSLASASRPRGSATPIPPSTLTPITGGFSPFNYRKPTIGGPVSSVTFASKVLQPGAAGDLVGLNFNAGARGSLAAQQGGFGQVFAPGTLLKTDRVEVERGGQTYAAQMVPLATYAAGEPANPAHVGSVKHALIVTTFPALAANATVQAMLRTSTVPTGGNVTIAAGDLVGFAGTLSINSGYARDSDTTIALTASGDLSPAAMFAVATPQVRFAGPLATEIRCIRDIPNTAYRVILDIRKHADGAILYDWQFRADKQRWVNPNLIRSYNVTVSITQGGTSIFSLAKRTFGGQIFTKTARSDRTAAVNAADDPHEHNIQIDAPEWSRIGAIPTYDYSTGVANAVLAAQLATIGGTSDWCKPLAANLLIRQMGATGGRSDLGAMPGWHAAYLQSGSEVMRRVVMAQGEACGAVPVHHVYADTGVIVNPLPTIGTPGIWTDERASNTWPANSLYGAYNTGWEFETAHQPAIALLPYLLTGRRYFGELLDSWAAAVINAIWIRQRNDANFTGPDWLLVTNNQERESGWALRDVSYAAGWSPDTSVLRPKWRDVLGENFRYLTFKRPTWTAIQGECYGWQPGTSYSVETSPWMQDHINYGVACAVRLNIPGAREHFSWLGNYRVNTGLQPDNVFFWKAAKSYRHFFVINGDSVTPQTNVKTWAALSLKTSDAATSQGQPWGGGNFEAIWFRSVCEHKTLLDTLASTALLARFAGDLPPTLTATNRRGGLEPLLDNFAPLARV